MGKKEDTAPVKAIEIATGLDETSNRLRILVQMATDECQWQIGSEEASGDAQERLSVLLHSIRAEVGLLEKLKDRAYKWRDREGAAA